MTSKERVKARYPSATHKRYRSIGGDVHYLIWSDYSQGYGAKCKRLGEGKTASSAWVDAASRLGPPTQGEVKNGR